MQDGTQIALNGTLFLPSKHYSRSSDGSSLRFTINESTKIPPIFLIFLAAFPRPVISLPITNITLFEGVSFPRIDLFVAQPHFPITFSCPLPPSVSLFPRNDGKSGYWIAGIWEGTGTGTFEFVISARNSRGSDSSRLRVNVLRNAQAFL